MNGEYYLDSAVADAVQLGLDCRVFEVEAYVSWGTPDELRTFEREYRTRLKTYLEGQLRDLEGRGSAAPSDGGRNGSGGYATSGYGSRAEAGS